MTHRRLQEPILADPPKSTQHAIDPESQVQKNLDFGHDHPGEWFVIAESNYRHQPAGRRMGSSAWERAYRKTEENGKPVYRTYVKYVGK